MNFVSLKDLYHDMAEWEKQLPYFDAVCGVPRSGLIPAAYIALRRNIRMVPIADLLFLPRGAIARAYLRPSNPRVKFKHEFGNKLLIVDDSSSNHSATFTELRKRLADQKDLDISYGAVYRASEKSKVDFYYREVPIQRVFEWNWFRHGVLHISMLDMDGVICEDWLGPPEQEDDPAFMEHLKNAKPLYVPQQPVYAIVTSRLSKYRKETEEWLEKHGVTYKALIMHNAKTPQERRKQKNHAKKKADAYAAAKDAILFVESSEKQAKEIHTITGKPVLCIDTMTMFNQ